MKSPFVRGMTTASWSATWCAGGRSGSGGQDRSEASLNEFFTWLGPKKCRKIRVVVMDMWKAFRKSTLKEGNAPQASIVYDKFHIVRHLGEALDKVRKREYARLVGEDRRFIKGQKYTLLSRWHNLSLAGRQALKLLFKANKRLNTAYLLKEAFDQLWDCETEGWARRFFDNWCDALKWQRLKPYRKFAAMIEKHWDGIVAYCLLEDKVPLGFVEGVNNKIRVLQKRAYGFRDEDYLRLKILTCMLPKL
jgi:transposase